MLMRRGCCLFITIESCLQHSLLWSFRLQGCMPKAVSGKPTPIITVAMYNWGFCFWWCPIDKDLIRYSCYQELERKGLVKRCQSDQQLGCIFTLTLSHGESVLRCYCTLPTPGFLEPQDFWPGTSGLTLPRAMCVRM